ncbi:hypothetical protein DMENIID0001_109200 [Sergentomyia squamirostris]
MIYNFGSFYFSAFRIIKFFFDRALYPYKAQNDDELSFEKDDIISVVGRDEPEWWRGELNGIQGLFPSNYVGPFVSSDILLVVLNELISEYLPNLFERLDQLGMIKMISLSWFLTIFLSVMAWAYESALHVIDCFFYDGALVLLSKYWSGMKKRCFHAMMDGEAMQILSTYLSGIYNPEYPTYTKNYVKHRTQKIETLIESAYQTFGESITAQKIEEMRNRHRRRIVHQFEQDAENSIIRQFKGKSHIGREHLLSVKYWRRQVIGVQCFTVAEVLDMIQGYGPVTQALLGTLLTWGLTAAGAAMVIFLRGNQVCPNTNQ